MLEIALQSWLLLTGVCLTLLTLVIAGQSLIATARRAKARLRENVTVTVTAGAQHQLYPMPNRH